MNLSPIQPLSATELSPDPFARQWHPVPTLDPAAVPTRPWPLVQADLRRSCGLNDARAIAASIEEIAQYPPHARQLLAEDVAYARRRLKRVDAACLAASTLLQGFLVEQTVRNDGTTDYRLLREERDPMTGASQRLASSDESVAVVEAIASFLSVYELDVPRNVAQELSEVAQSLQRQHRQQQLLLQQDELRRQRELIIADLHSERDEADEAHNPPPASVLTAMVQRASVDPGAAARILEETSVPAQQPPTDRPLFIVPETPLKVIPTTVASDVPPLPLPRNDPLKLIVAEEGMHRQSFVDTERQARVALWRAAAESRANDLLQNARCWLDAATGPPDLVRSNAAPFVSIAQQRLASADSAPNADGQLPAGRRTPFGLAHDFAMFINANVMATLAFTAASQAIDREETAQRIKILQELRAAVADLTRVARAMHRVATAHARFVTAVVAEENGGREAVCTLEYNRRCEIAAELRLVHAAARRFRTATAALVDVVASEGTARRRQQEVFEVELAAVRAIAWEDFQAVREFDVRSGRRRQSGGGIDSRRAGLQNPPHVSTEGLLGWPDIAPHDGQALSPAASRPRRIGDPALMDPPSDADTDDVRPGCIGDWGDTPPAGDAAFDDAVEFPEDDPTPTRSSAGMTTQDQHQRTRLEDLYDASR